MYSPHGGAFKKKIIGDGHVTGGEGGNTSEGPTAAATIPDAHDGIVAQGIYSYATDR
jgi:hypothetical protein